MVDFLRDFIHILRSSDLRVSTSESIDAMNVVSEIGLEDRSLLKHSLSFSLAKTLREKEIFNECFDNFFEENYMNLTEDKLPQKNNEKDSEIKKLASRRVKLGLIINSISEKNEINIEDSDLTQAVVSEASKYPGQEKQVMDYFKNNPEAYKDMLALEKARAGAIGDYKIEEAQKQSENIKRNLIQASSKYTADDYQDLNVFYKDPQTGKPVGPINATVLMSLQDRGLGFFANEFYLEPK